VNKEWVREHSKELVTAASVIIAALIGGLFLLAANKISTAEFRYIELDPTNGSVESSSSRVSSEKIGEGVNVAASTNQQLSMIPSKQFQDIYNFAYSARGMNQTREHAKEFSRLVAENCNFEQFTQFSEEYKFAYSSSGMNQTREQALQWSKNRTACLR
jgi:hypothetical protein